MNCVPRLVVVLALVTTLALAAHASGGACCLDDGSCVDVPAVECGLLHGLFQGDGTTCLTTPPCVPFGACCFPDLTCTAEEASTCGTLGGVYQGNGVDCTPALCPAEGACCLDDGTCLVVTLDACVAVGGIAQGFLVACGDVVCRGACSFEDASCLDARTVIECGAAGGLFQGHGTVCVGLEHPALVQCQTFSFDQNAMTTLVFDPFDDDGGRRLLQRVSVELEGRIYARVNLLNLSDGEVDTDLRVSEHLRMVFPAFMPGPFVAVDVVDDIIACGGGVTLPPQESCDYASPLLFPGMAMDETSDPADFGIFETGPLPATIEATGTFTYDGSQFILTQAPHRAEGKVLLRYEFVVQAACCQPDGTCDLAPEDACDADGGIFQGVLVTCTDVVCPAPPGACCFSGGICQELEPLACALAGGADQGLGATCAVIECTGACCFFDGTCTFVIEARCIVAGGTWQGGGTACDPNPCPPLTGACCLPGSTCQDLEPLACLQSGGVFQGTTTACAGGACGPVCPADVDGDGQVAFGDLLLVLSAWGPCAACPEDVDQDDVVGFADLLLVLSAWGPC